MGRRRKKESVIAALLVLPWWVSAVLGALAFIALAGVIPALFSQSRLLFGLAELSRSVAWLPLCAFGVIALIAFIKAKTKSTITLPSPSRLEPLSRLDRPETTPRFDFQRQAVVLTKAELFTGWSLDTLRALEWKQFELLCARYYQAAGFRAVTLPSGADGGIDIKLFKNDNNRPIAIVQCKAWNTYAVGVKEIRELLGVMAHEKVRRCIFIATGTYTKDASEFGRQNPIQLLDGTTFLNKILALSREQQQTLLAFAFDGDYQTPTCPSCGIKMVKREGKRGAFWGCTGYPRCKSTFALSKATTSPMT